MTTPASSAMPVPFGVADPLPTGTTLIEASAGTGKTYTLAALAVRYVAEDDIPIDQILLVTFTRAATAELRHRIRETIRAGVRHLDGTVGDTGDPILAALADCDDPERTLRRERLRRALTDFDTASISTIHGFCSQVQAQLGVLSGGDGAASMVASEARMITQVCTDRYFSHCSGRSDNPFATRTLTHLIDHVTKARSLADSTVEAVSDHPDDLFFAEVVREISTEIDHRLDLLGGTSYDSLLVSVRRALTDDRDLLRTQRARFRVAMIDEFQDTDPVQWNIFELLFGAAAPSGASPTLILVGDPKQAIYSFRGGDVYTYLTARAHADLRVLAENQRSSPQVVGAMNALGAGQVFGDERIAYVEVEPAVRNAGLSIERDGAARPAGLQVRVLDRSPEESKVSAATSRRTIARDLAGVVVGLLEHESITDGLATGPRPTRPNDIAILVGSTADATPMAAALRDAGVPYVLRLRDDIGDSEAVAQWRILLHALDRPASVTRAGAAALTWFIGKDPTEVLGGFEVGEDDGDDDGADVPPVDTTDEQLVELQHELVDWNDLLIRKGMPALLAVLRQSHGMVARLLEDPDGQGERRLTDLEHLAELIHAEGGGAPGTTAGTALAILDSLGGTPDDEVAADAAQRRIDSDADAVQILTIHAAKGLEFPIVLLPTLAAGGQRVQGRAPYAYYDQVEGRRKVDVSTKHIVVGRTGRPLKDPKLGPEAKLMAGEVKRQNCGEQHRLTYVALTRASHLTVAWWYHGSNAHSSGLTRLLLGPPDGDAAQQVPIPEGGVADAIRDRVAATGAGDLVEVVEIGPVISTPRLVRSTDRQGEGELAVAHLGRSLDRSDATWSFTALSGGAHDRAQQVVDHLDPTVEAAADRGVADELTADEPDDVVVAPPGSAVDAPAGAPAPPPSLPFLDGDVAWSRTSPFEGIGGGTTFGKLVHALLEKVSFEAPDLEAAFTAVLATAAGRGATDLQREVLPSLLADVMRTPLGPAFGDICLADVEPADHLDELTFHLPLPTGRDGSQPLVARRIGDLVADHLTGPDDGPLRDWATRLADDLGGGCLQGFLTGSIDLTLRYPDPAGGPARYSIVDYKTNQLSPRGAPHLLAHYRRPAVLQAMAGSDYLLQALIYSVALHRYLRWRLPGYDPATHLGPVGYLFVRAMVGPSTPVDADGRAGVFTWSVPPKLVEDLSDLFAGHDVRVAS